MVPRIAVVTDSVSNSFYFPLFLNYYRRELPGADIYVLTPAGRADLFSGFGLAGTIELPIDFYDDTVRAKAMSDLVTELTTRYTHVVRVDCDEFAVPDPRHFASLQDYIAATPQDYITAYGYDIVAARSDSPLDFSKPILGTQRKFAFAVNALNKTCLTSVPLTWGRGFHACQKPPVFDRLFLMHMKRADIDLQFRFGRFIAELTRQDAYIKQYYLTPRDQIVSFHNNLFEREILQGWDRFPDNAFLDAFLTGLKQAPDAGIWEIEFNSSPNLAELPPEFTGRF